MDPKIGLVQSLKPELQQKLAPQLLQANKILQMPSNELREHILQEVEENPLLELQESESSSQGSESSSEDIQNEDNLEEEKLEETIEQDFSLLESFNAAYADYEPRPFRRWDPEEDKKQEFLQNIPQSSTLHEHLIQQLHFMDLSEKITQICEEIVYNLNEEGYLLCKNLEEIQKSLQNNPDFQKKPFEITQADLEKALQIVQSLEPKGVGARNEKECLLLQLEDMPNCELERYLIQYHLEDVKKNRFPQIQKKTGYSLEDIKQAVQHIRKLDAKPGLDFSSQAVQYIQPDIVVEEVDGEFVVHILSNIPEVRVSDHYKKLYEKIKKLKNSEDKKFIKKKLESAKQLIEAIEQRQKTLQRITEEIVNVQKDFLKKGISHLKPLTMQQIADAVKVNVSTVSRAVSGKYIQTPQGIFKLADLFNGATKNKNNEETSSTLSTKEKIAKIIRDEDKQNPLSDEQITEILKKEGLCISRRTVAKYRKQLKIPSSRERKEY
ncbi:MAG: RNA polymerase sigma-54 factor [Planctomycetota bacterium]|nr:MAG: RNA polymerase sigma-54 factor [Planctomycetota bacterium]